MPNLEQCPYSKAVRCKMDEPCGPCETFGEFQNSKEHKTSITEIIREIYNDEKNFRVTSFWDAGYTFSLGDDINGFTANYETHNFDQGIAWLYSKITKG